MDADKKPGRGDALLREMLDIYCRGRHGRGGLCPDCAALLDYARERESKCPHKETKTFCSACKTHCYKPEMRGRIRRVMRYAGPRMIFRHPIIFIRHLYAGKKEKTGE